MSYAPVASEPPLVVRVDDASQTESPKAGAASGSSFPPASPSYRKAWRGGLFDCFGDCSSSDFGSCCLVFWVPFIAFGCAALALRVAAASRAACAGTSKPLGV